MSGELPECLDCDGTGDCPECENLFTAECGMCEGTGECPTCDGSGTAPWADRGWPEPEVSGSEGVRD